MIAVVLQVPILNGKPNVTLPDKVTAEITPDNQIITLTHESGEQATFRFLGVVQSEAILSGMANRQIATWMIGQGITVTRIKDATQAQRDWLAARGATAANAGHHFCGLPQGDTDEGAP